MMDKIGLGIVSIGLASVPLCIYWLLVGPLNGLQLALSIVGMLILSVLVYTLLTDKFKTLIVSILAFFIAGISAIKEVIKRSEEW